MLRRRLSTCWTDGAGKTGNGGVFLKNKRKLCLYLALILILNVVVIGLAQDSLAATYKRGSSGQTVKTIQQKLKTWGYYTGAVDGIYGSGTEKAVKAFQAKNGLTADGKAGPKTLAAMGISSGSTSSSGTSGDVALLARLISAEARGEPYSGQVAVGAVVLNRMKHPSFPNTMSGVIYQPGAFSCMYDGQFNQPVADSAYKAAREAMNGSDPSGGAIYYFNPATATSKWIWSRPLIVVIGKHRFCS
jgi:N-acetylmuramoyl-L-alanine amidase